MRLRSIPPMSADWARLRSSFGPICRSLSSYYSPPFLYFGFHSDFRESDVRTDRPLPWDLGILEYLAKTDSDSVISTYAEVSTKL